MKSSMLFKIGVLLCALSVGVTTVFVLAPRLPMMLLSEYSEADAPVSSDEQKVELTHAQRRRAVFYSQETAHVPPTPIRRRAPTIMRSINPQSSAPLNPPLRC